MKKIVALCLIACLVLNATAMAGINSKKAAYNGCTMKDKDFAGAKEAVEGTLDTSDEKELKFE